jgi:hypothetical protein
MLQTYFEPWEHFFEPRELPLTGENSIYQEIFLKTWKIFLVNSVKNSFAFSLARPF